LDEKQTLDIGLQTLDKNTPLLSGEAGRGFLFLSPPFSRRQKRRLPIFKEIQDSRIDPLTFNLFFYNGKIKSGEEMGASYFGKKLDNLKRWTIGGSLRDIENTK
jgi:hypothetical protein